MTVLMLSSCINRVNTEITGDELLNHTSYLASEDLKGRFPGTEGDIMAADYILDRFREYGLDVQPPAGLQKFEIVTSVAIGDSNRMAWKDEELEVGRDYLPLSFSPDGEIRGQVVFAGYGISADKEGFKWDDFRDAEMNGKIALFLEGGPREPEDGPDPFEGLLSQRSKILQAQDRGAAGVMFVAGPVFDEADDLEFRRNKEAPSGIPALRVSRNFANRLLGSSGYSIEGLEEKSYEQSQEPLELDETVYIRTNVMSEKVTTHNVIGILNAPHGEFSDEYVVVGAHYDHLGTGGEGTGSRVPDTVAVHYGADDNASGTAGIIELAGFFSGKRQEITRSMVFVAFGAEEMGLLGSKYFVENPPVKLDKIEVMINLDMIGRLNDETRVSIGGTGTAAEFDSLFGLVEPFGLNPAFSPEGSGPSDHASFYAKDIPVLFVSTGAHPDYHTPGDSVGKLNIDGMAMVSEYLADLTSVLASQEALSFRESGPKRTTSSRQNLKVTLGFMPDFTDNSNEGLRVDFPTPGKPAALAGIEKGDRIIGINGMKVTNIQDYMVRLQSLEPGQIVTVEIMRNKEKQVLLVQL